MYEESQEKKSGHSKVLCSQIHCYWWISTLLKYFSFLGVKNVRGASIDFLKVVRLVYTCKLMQIFEIILHQSHEVFTSFNNYKVLNNYLILNPP